MSADLHTLTGAYAADALSDTEQLAFERHLTACPACAQEVRTWDPATATPGQVWLIGPEHLRALYASPDGGRLLFSSLKYLNIPPPSVTPGKAARAAA